MPESAASGGIPATSGESIQPVSPEVLRLPPAPKPKPIPAGQTVADQRLQRIYDSQQQLLAHLAAHPDTPDAERDQRLQNLLNRYQSLLLDNPDYVYGYILYGKLLRDVGQRELANLAFLRANELNSDIAVVKQQIANYLTEEGEYGLALPYYLAAISLEPQVAVYHYQLGEVLHTYRAEFLEDNKLTQQTLEKQMQDAFANAARLDPHTRTYALRHAESFFDVASPDWQQALALWEALQQTATDPLQAQIIALQKARVLLALGENAQAAKALESVTDATLREAKSTLLQSIRPQPKLPTAP